MFSATITSATFTLAAVNLNGSYNLSGSGVLTTFEERRGPSRTGTFTQSGGINRAMDYLYIAGSSGTYSLSGSALLSAPTENVGYAGGGTFSQSGGTNLVTSLLELGGSGTYNLNGGELVTPAIEGNGVFNLGGGTLVAGGGFTTSQAMTLTGSGGSGAINTGEYQVALSGDLSGPGGLVVLGDGTLILTGSNSYSGGTVVEYGTLEVSSAAALPQGGSLIVGAGGTLIFDPTVAAAPTTKPSFVAVPEPDALALLVAAVLVAATTWRRRNFMKKNRGIHEPQGNVETVRQPHLACTETRLFVLRWRSTIRVRARGTMASRNGPVWANRPTRKGNPMNTFKRWTVVLTTILLLPKAAVCEPPPKSRKSDVAEADDTAGQVADNGPPEATLTTRKAVLGPPESNSANDDVYLSAELARLQAIQETARSLEAAGRGGPERRAAGEAPQKQSGKGGWRKTGVAGFRSHPAAFRGSPKGLGDAAALAAGRQGTGGCQAKGGSRHGGQQPLQGRGHVSISTSCKERKRGLRARLP